MATSTYDYGPQALKLRMVRGDDFEMVLDVEGNRAADTFAAAMAPRSSPSSVTSFAVTVGAYVSADGTTPVTVALDSTTSAALTPGDWDWDLEWTSGGAARTLVAGQVIVTRDYA